MKYYLYLVLACIAYGIYLFAYNLLHGDMLFHTDIARDFLLIQDIAVNHKLTLIGSRAGGIPGVFFGPAWLYFNIPAFVIGGGNPLVVGWFWFLLDLFTFGAVFYVTKKVFNTTVGILATALFIYTIIFLAPGYTSSFGAVVISPFLLYSVYLFIEKKRIKYLSWAAFLSAFIIQFQPAYGSIMVCITFFLSLVVLIRRKQIRYQLVWFIAVIPLLSYIIFELRHNFLETRAFYDFIFHHNSITYSQETPQEVTVNREQGILGSLNLISINTLAYNIFFVLLNLFICYRWIRAKKSGQRTFILLVYLYYVVFWIITFLFKGTVWNYYYWGLFAVLPIPLASLFLRVDKRLYIIGYTILLFLMMQSGYRIINGWQTTFSGKDTSSWIINKEVAQYVYQDAKNQDFGYYVYSTDNFGYSKKYAMSYLDMTGEYKEKGFLCQKRPTTYLIYEATSPGTHTDPVFWKNASVSIKTKPIAVKNISTVKIEKYKLTPKQVKNPSDPTMICGLQWR